MTLKNLLTRVQSDIGDISFSTLQRAEYLEFAQVVAEEIGFKTRTWIVNLEVEPIPEISYTYDDEAARLAAVGFVTGDINKIALQVEDDTYWKLTDDSPITWEQIDPYVAKFVNTPSIARILRVARAGQEGLETSMQSIKTVQTNNYPYSLNMTHFTYARYASFRNQDDDLELHFPVPFEPGVIVELNAISLHPYTMGKWSESTTIPEHLHSVFHQGILYYAMHRLYMQGTEHMQNRFMIAQREYKRCLLDAQAYTRNFLDTRSAPQNQPFRWLPEQ